jgi:hypothetical protein
MYQTVYQAAAFTMQKEGDQLPSDQELVAAAVQQRQAAKEAAATAAAALAAAAEAAAARVSAATANEEGDTGSGAE